VDPDAMRGPSATTARRRGVATTPVTKGATFGGTGALAASGRGSRMASASLSARSMLPAEWGAHIAATSGDGAAKAPPGAEPRRVRAEEALGAARFSPPRVGAPMHRGPLALGAPMAGIFGLFLLPRGRSRCFFPVAVDPAVAEGEEGSMALGSSLSSSLME
jgi:hypothetical protein